MVALLPSHAPADDTLYRCLAPGEDPAAWWDPLLNSSLRAQSAESGSLCLKPEGTLWQPVRA
eukprot:1159033-Pelagomonas_calceolata.AAC.4